MYINFCKTTTKRNFFYVINTILNNYNYLCKKNNMKLIRTLQQQGSTTCFTCFLCVETANEMGCITKTR